jgi:hypothetical protein
MLNNSVTILAHLFDSHGYHTFWKKSSVIVNILGCSLLGPVGKQETYVTFLCMLSTGHLFYGVLEHTNFCRVSQWMQAFYVMEPPCWVV